MVPAKVVPASVTPMCSGYGELVGEQPVRADTGVHAGGLRADDDVLEAARLEVAAELHGAGCELALERPVEVVELLGEAAGVHADTNRDSRLPCRVDDCVDARHVADVARIDAQLCCTGAGGIDGDGVVEVDVGDDGKGRSGDYLRERFEGVPPRNRNAHDLAPGGVQPCDLGQRRLDIAGVGVRHRLHDDRGAASDRRAANRYRTGVSASHLGRAPLLAAVIRPGLRSGRCPST